MEIGNVSDDTSHDWMMLIGQASRRDVTSYWLANDAGLGVISTIVTNTGDHIVWSP
jgi:hypothetical protein